jgi:septum formation protein
MVCCVRPKSMRPELVLASRSPRRRQLLHEHGFGHRCVDAGVDDGLLVLPERGVSPAGWTLSLAWLKARAGAESAARELACSAASIPSALILAADTVVVHRGQVIGQPADADDAARIIHQLADDWHEVITGVVLLESDPDRGSPRSRWLVDRASVWLGPLPAGTIREYVQSGRWRGKAGGYNLSEQLEAGWPIDFRGDPTSIMGLPMARLAPILSQRLDQHPSEQHAPPLSDRAASPHSPPSCSSLGCGCDDPLHDSAEGVLA